MVQSRFIEKHMLDPKLREELDNKSLLGDVLLKEDFITADNLDSLVLDRISNPLNNAGIIYDDSELNQRIDNIRAGKMNETLAFVKDADHFSREMLEYELQQKLDLESSMPLKTGKEYVDNTFRRLDTSIEEDQFVQEWQDQFTDIIQKVNSTSSLASDTGNVFELLNAIESDLNAIENNKIDDDIMNSEYYHNNIQLPLNAFSSDIQNAINKVPQIETDLINAANTVYLEANFRRKDVPILKSELDASLVNKIASANASVGDVTGIANRKKEELYNTYIRPGIINYYGSTGSYGDDTSNPVLQVEAKETYFYPYAFAVEMTMFSGTYGLNRPDAPDARGGKMTYSSALDYLYSLGNSFTSNLNQYSSRVNRAENRIELIKEDIDDIDTALANLERRISALESMP